VRNSNLDDDVARAWKASSRDKPPAALDEALRAAARREVGARPRRRTSPAWIPMAVAATLGAVAVAIVQLAPPERLTERPSVNDAETGLAGGRLQQGPVPEASQPPAGPHAGQQAEQLNGASAPRQRSRMDAAMPSQSVAKPRREEDQPHESAEPRRALGAGPLPQPFPDVSGRVEAGASAGPSSGAPPPGATRPDAAPARSSAPDARKGTSRPAAPAESANTDRSAAVAETPAARSKAFAEASRPERPVAEWIALIRKLRTEGRTDEAAKELADFRSAHGANADALLPPDLRQAPAL
jgi:hypothetical protein